LLRIFFDDLVFEGRFSGLIRACHWPNIIVYHCSFDFTKV
jgi:hypothetical protein